MFDSHRNFMSPEKLLAENYQKNSLFPSIVKFVEWNTKEAIFSIEGCWGPNTIVP